jgi:hypothetical protein
VDPGAIGGLAAVGGDVALPMTPGFGGTAGIALLSAVLGTTGLVQSALLAAGFGRAAARAAAEPPFSAEPWLMEFDITGVPSCTESLPPGVPVSTPPGICDVCEEVGRRGGALVTGTCASAAVCAKTSNAAASAAQRTADVGFTIDS